MGTCALHIAPHVLFECTYQKLHLRLILTVWTDAAAVVRRVREEKESEEKESEKRESEQRELEKRESEQRESVERRSKRARR